MADKVKLSKDGSSIDFVQSESIPTTVKKFRQSPEIEGFYRFIFENDLQKEAYEILDKIIRERKAKKKESNKELAKEAAAAKEKLAQQAGILKGKKAKAEKADATVTLSKETKVKTSKEKVTKPIKTAKPIKVAKVAKVVKPKKASVKKVVKTTKKKK